MDHLLSEYNFEVISVGSDKNCLEREVVCWFLWMVMFCSFWAVEGIFSPVFECRREKSSVRPELLLIGYNYVCGRAG